MPLRDDHEAALARADALQRQLDEERARGSEEAEQVKRLEGELTELRARLDSAEAALSGLGQRPAGRRAQIAPRPPTPPEMSELELEDRPEAPWLRIVVGLSGLVLIYLWAALGGRC